MPDTLWTFVFLVGFHGLILLHISSQFEFSEYIETIVTERLRTSSRYSSRKRLPKTLVLYFPQYHKDPLNDKNWGPNFTDWDSLRSSPKYNKLNQSIPRPLMAYRAHGIDGKNDTNDFIPPLGYYDLKERQPRQIQGDLAKKYGIDGFIYHHYWFYDTTHKGPNLAKPLENMLEDGHPDVPFVLNWCTVRWYSKWMGKAIFEQTGRKKSPMILQEQYFSVTQEMVYEHYSWLKQFFDHPNYIHVDGQPVFVLYYYDVRALPILESLRRFAIADGFPGLYFIVGRSAYPEDLYDINHLEIEDQKHAKKRLQTLDLIDPTKSSSQTKSVLPALLNASDIKSLLRANTGQVRTGGSRKEMKTWDYNPFNQTMLYPYPLGYVNRPYEVPNWCKQNTVNPTVADATNNKSGAELRPEIIGVVTTFDNTPRRKFSDANVWNGGRKDTVESPEDSLARFKKSYFSTLYYQKCCVGRNQNLDSSRMNYDDRFVVINAMNEWGEGMAIEPSDVYGYGWLETILYVQQHVQKLSCDGSSHFHYPS